MKSPLGRHEIGAPHYQDKLANLIREEKPLIVVETGLYQGLGAEYILRALDDNGIGKLYSIDPSPQPDFLANPIKHPRFTWIKGRSQDVLPELVKETGEFGLFVHDSDHGYDCQKFEYDFAWNHVRIGGIIATDDPFWGDPPHHAWNQFLTEHGITERHIIGNAQWVRRTV